MSSWKFLVRRLYDLGGTAPLHQLDDGTIYSFNKWAVEEAVSHQLIIRPRRGGRRPGPYILTQRGKDYCEKKITIVGWTRKGKRFYHSTWLVSLPQVDLAADPGRLGCSCYRSIASSANTEENFKGNDRRSPTGVARIRAWKLAVYHLYQLRGEATAFQISTEAGLNLWPALQEAREHGLVRRKKKEKKGLYALTRKGKDFCEGRIRWVNWGHLGAHFEATWFAPLPRLRLASRKSTQCERCFPVVALPDLNHVST